LKISIDLDKELDTPSFLSPKSPSPSVYRRFPPPSRRYPSSIFGPFSPTFFLGKTFFPRLTASSGIMPSPPPSVENPMLGAPNTSPDLESPPGFRSSLHFDSFPSSAPRERPHASVPFYSHALFPRLSIRRQELAGEAAVLKPQSSQCYVFIPLRSVPTLTGEASKSSFYPKGAPIPLKRDRKILFCPSPTREVYFESFQPPPTLGECRPPKVLFLLDFLRLLAFLLSVRGLRSLAST